MTFYTLQFLRFIAALLVLLFHLFIVHSGYKGVDIFFVISGFVMYYTLFARKRPNAIHFVVNRATKIFFLYWVALLFLYFVDPTRFEHLSMKSVLLVPSHKSLIGVSWSLSFELYFYFLVGTSAYLIPGKYHKPLFILLFSITTIVTVVDLLFTDKLQHTTLNYVLGPNFWEFLLGILSAHLAIRYNKFFSYKMALLLAIMCLVSFSIISIKYMEPVTYVIYGPLSFMAVMLFTAYEQQKRVNKRFTPIFKVIGDASYGIYLFGPIITLVILPIDTIAKIKIIAVTITVSIIFNQLIENNFLMFIRKTLYNKFPKK